MQNKFVSELIFINFLKGIVQNMAHFSPFFYKRFGTQSSSCGAILVGQLRGPTW